MHSVLPIYFSIKIHLQEINKTDITTSLSTNMNLNLESKYKGQLLCYHICTTFLHSLCADFSFCDDRTEINNMVYDVKEGIL